MKICSHSKQNKEGKLGSKELNMYLVRSVNSHLCRNTAATERRRPNFLASRKKRKDVDH